MRLLVISLCTKGVMHDHFISYCKRFAKSNELYCITNNNITNEELEALETLNVSYERRNPLGYFSHSKLKKIKEYIKRINPDIVYVFTHHATSIFLARFLKKYRLIYQVHDPFPHEGIDPITRMILNIQLKQYSTVADKLIVAGEAVKKQVLERCKINENKIIPIPFGVLDNFIDDEIEPIKKEVDVFYYGRIEPYKGLDLLVDAASKLNKSTKVFIAGGGDIRQSFPGISAIPKNVSLLGFIDDKTLISYIKASKLVVFPYREASGTFTVCQCCYYGKPMIVTDVGVLPEYVGEGGIVLKKRDSRELANQIEKLLNNHNLRQQLADNARDQYLKCFKIENACQKHQELFNEMIKTKKEHK